MPEIKNTKFNNRAKTTTAIIKNTERILSTSATQFIEGTPIECNYYSIDYEASSTGVGFQDNSNPYDGGVKYKFIKDYIMYGYNEVKEMSVDEKDEIGIHYKLDETVSLHLPLTLVPKVGDRLTLHIENNQNFYKVISVTNTTFHNKPYVRTEWTKDTNLPDINWTHNNMVSNKLITEELRYVPENIGTEYSAFLHSDFYEKINKLTEARYELNELYVDYFYDEFRNIFTYDTDDGSGTRVYFPILVDIQMEFKPLYIYDINMVLHHETIVNSRSLKNWKKSKLRSFIKKRDNTIINDGHLFKKYLYTTNVHSENYKLCSFLNDDRVYLVYDYGEGNTIKIPDTFIEVFTKYCEKSLSLDYLLDNIDNLLDIDIEVEYLLYTPILISIIDIFIDECLIEHKINRFY